MIGWLWLQADRTEVSDSERAQTNEPAVETPTSVTPAIALDDDDAGFAPAASRNDDEMAALLGRVTDAYYTGIGPKFIDYLASQGLSRADSERAVAAGFRDWVQCQVDATLYQAETQSVSREAVLSAWDTQGALPTQLDVGAALERAQPCMTSAQLRMGLPAETMTYWAPRSRAPTQ